MRELEISEIEMISGASFTSRDDVNSWLDRYWSDDDFFRPPWDGGTEPIVL